MNKMLIATVALLALAGCASQQAPSNATNTGTAAASNMQLADVSSIDSTIEVTYTCDSPEGPKKVGAMYGVKDNTLVVAQIKIGDQLTPGLYRVLNDAQGERQNSYYGNGLTWTTGKATPANAKKVNGDMLTQASALDAMGAPVGTQTVLLRTCRAN